jgi:phage tail-like protein
MALYGIGNVDPFRAFKFIVTVQGPNIFGGGGVVNGANINGTLSNTMSSMGFAKVTGLNRETEVAEYREGGENTTMHVYPGQVKYDPIILERGATADPDLYNWAAQVDGFDGAGIGASAAAAGNLGQFNPTRATLTISCLNANLTKLLTWTVRRAFVSRLQGGDFDAKTNEILMESVTVRHEGFFLTTRAVNQNDPSTGFGDAGYPAVGA